MELHQVRYFVALCKLLNFTRAAQSCRVTQPALTRGIQRLEQELGGPLFRRERNLTQLTELGRLMQPQLEQMLAMAEVAFDNAKRFNKNEFSSLRIGVPPAVAGDLATASLSEVARRFPMLDITLVSTAQKDVVARLLEGGLDGTFLVDEGRLPERLNRWPLYSEGFRFAVSPTHPLAKHELILPAAMHGQALIACTDCAGVATLKQKCGTAGVEFKVPYVVDSYDHAQLMAATGLGAAWLPERLPLRPPLLPRYFAEALPLRTIALAVVGGRPFSAALGAYIKLVRALDLRAAPAAPEAV